MALERAPYEPPPPSECDSQTHEVELAGEIYRIVQRMQYHGGRLVEFAIILCKRDRRGNWSEIYSVDTKHGSLHVHPTGHRTPERHTVSPIYTQVDVQESFDIGYRMVEEWHIRESGG